KGRVIFGWYPFTSHYKLCKLIEMALRRERVKIQIKSIFVSGCESRNAIHYFRLCCAPVIQRQSVQLIIAGSKDMFLCLLI
ncbi:hypothetical protein OLZ31_26630, partial [Enterobacter asburiae]|nr:hypothetical protein [Enterobacter asburiae]